MPRTATSHCPLADATDADLLRLHTEGNPDACTLLYRRHEDRMMAVARHIAGQDADDAVQNGFIRVCDTAGSFRGHAAVTTWMHRIVRNAAIDITRRRVNVAELDPEQPELAGADHRQMMRRQDIKRYEPWPTRCGTSSCP